MPAYPTDVRKAVDAIRSSIETEGWTVDMVLDFGSHAYGEARPDSDYDLFVYVHRDGWLWWFDEYARRAEDPDDGAHGDREELRLQFPGYVEASGRLRSVAQEAADAAAPGLEVQVPQVFDMRQILYGMGKGTWQLFELAGAFPLTGAKVHSDILGFLWREQPFNAYTVHVHLTQCECARRPCEEALAAAVADAAEGVKARRRWLTCATAWLRNSLALLSLIEDGWFVTKRDEVTAFAQRRFPGQCDVLSHLYSMKCDAEMRSDFAAHGAAEVEGLHGDVAAFAHVIRSAAQAAVASHPTMATATAAQLAANRRLFERLPIYTELVEGR